jgi:TonB family protein
LPFDQVKTQVLLLHSEQRTLDHLSSGFTDSYTVHCATSGTEALNTLTETPIHVIISAQELPGMSGIEALREAKKRSPETIGILLASRDDDDLEALVGCKEVFQIVHGGVSAEDISKLVDNATQQMRLLALAESANDMAANPDEPVTEHIIMETSENGSAIISDGTGTVPVLDPKKISAAAAVGSRSVDVLVLTKDDEFLATVRESSRGMHNIRYANTLAQAEQAITKYKIGVAVVDAAMAGPNVEKLTEHLRGKTPRLVSIVAGRRDDGEMLMDLINRGKVYRFLLKPVSPGRARLAVEASVKHHLEAPESAFKASGTGKAAPAPKPKATSRPQPAAKPRPKAKAAPQAKAAPRPAAKAAPKPAPKAAAKPRPTPRPTPRHVETSIEITPSLENDRLASAFDGDDTSITETVTGIVASIGEKIASRKREKEAQAAPAPTPAASADSSGASPFTNPRILGIGAVAVVAVIAIGAWTFSGSDETSPGAEPVAFQGTPANANPEISAPTTGEIASGRPPQGVVTAAEIDAALADAEAAMLDRRSDDAATALSIVSNADPDNARLPFLTAQLSQMQLREYLDNARAAIRDARLEDAASDLRGAGALNIADTTEIDAVAAELAAAHSEQRLDTVLAQATDRLDQGKLLAPANDNAGYFYNLVLSSDPENAAAQQGLTMIASKLVLQARTEIDANRFDSASGLLDDARRLDSSSSELATATQALADARNRVFEDARRAEANRVASEKAEADRMAAEKRAEDNRKAAAIAATALAAEKARADRLATEKAEADRLAAQKAEADRLAAQKAEADRLAAQKVEADRLAAQKVEADRLAAEKVEADRLAAQKMEADRLAAEKAEADRLAAQKMEADRLAAEKVEADRLAAEKVETDRRAAAVAAAAVAAAANPPAAQAVGSQSPQTGNVLREEPVGISSLTRLKYVAPKYPRAAERRNLSGWVDIVFTVATDGTTKDVVVRESEPGQTFDKAAVRAVEKWRFMPVFDNGMVVEKRAGVRMMFAIE